jgi:hypothetical protein
MHPDNRTNLEQRVIRAAEAALADHQYVSAIDVLTGMGLLQPSHVQDWRKGRLDFLERMIQGNLKKISLAMKTFRTWAHAKGLKPSETQYLRTTREGARNLQFSVSGDPSIEKSYRTHFVSPALSERKQARLQEKLDKAPDPVVFEIVTDSQCSECGAELPRGSFLYMEAGQPLCLPCARMDDLEFLPSGDTALTRRAGKNSNRRAVVVRFSRSRGRYERQGILVEKAALEKAEQESMEDADERARDRSHAAEIRKVQDRAFIERMTAELLVQFPGCPPAEARAIAAHAAERGSGRVGRTAAARELDLQPVTLAVIAAIRHNHTNYDELLSSGVPRESARRKVADQVEEILDRWRG